MTDPAEIRADGRRLLADLAAARETIDGDRVEDAKEAWVNFTYQHHDVLLADPAPVGLTEDEIDAEVTARLSDTERMGWVVAEKLAEENLRLSAAPVDDRERVPEGWRVEWIECRHYRPEESHPVPRLIEIVPSCEGHRRLVPVSPSVDPEEKP